MALFSYSASPFSNVPSSNPSNIDTGNSSPFKAVIGSEIFAINEFLSKLLP